MLVVGGSDSAA